MPTPKIGPKGGKKPQRAKKVQKRPQMWGRLKNKKIGLFFQNESGLSTKVGPKKDFKPDPNPRNSLERPEEGKMAHIWLNKKQKDRQSRIQLFGGPMHRNILRPLK